MKVNTIEVSRDDLRAVCETVLSTWFDYSDSRGDHCTHCGCLVPSKGEPKHSTDCVVLVARDIMPKEETTQPHPATQEETKPQP